MRVIFLLLLLIISSFYFVSEGYAQTREEVGEGSKSFTKTYPELRAPELDKIDRVIAEWKVSLTPRFSRCRFLGHDYKRVLLGKTTAYS